MGPCRLATSEPVQEQVQEGDVAAAEQPLRVGADERRVEQGQQARRPRRRPARTRWPATSSSAKKAWSSSRRADAGPEVKNCRPVVPGGDAHAETQAFELGHAPRQPLRVDGARGGAHADEIAGPEGARADHARAGRPLRSAISSASLTRSEPPAARRAFWGSGSR